jgi:hypothetical protein
MGAVVEDKKSFMGMPVSFLSIRPITSASTIDIQHISSAIDFDAIMEHLQISMDIILPFSR